MSDVLPNPDDQAALWNGPSGRAWVDNQELLDQILRPFEELMVGGAEVTAGERVLDVGCGTGSTTIAMARRVGGGGCTGVDISEPMIERARERAASEPVPPSFVCADAQTYGFAPAAFELITSRFGVMFFEDPVAAFANLGRAAAAGGRLRMVAWRSAAENPFMTTAERAAAPLLPALPARRPDGPGQFGFGERARVEQILGDSGWQAIDVAPVDVPCAMPAARLPYYITRLGPVGRVLQDADEATRTRVMERVEAAFVPFVDGDQVRFTGAVWLIGATRAS